MTDSLTRVADAPRTVLIVDDNPQLRDFVADSLAELGGFRVVTAADGDEGLARYYDGRPDCVVIDVRMPGLDGYQLVRALRGDPDSAQTPLVILTAMTQDRERFAGLAVGADQYLLKPVMPLDLVAAIQQAIRLTEEERLRRWWRALEAEPSR